MQTHRPLIHIGYHKTGSTWLQHNLLSHEPTGFTQPFPGNLIRQHFVAQNTLRFSPQVSRQVFFPGLEAAPGIAVIPDERLSGHPDSGGYDSYEIARRLAAVFPEARVLIVVREQKEIIRSAYAQYVRFGGIETIEQYVRGRLDSAVPRFERGFYEYHWLVAAYYELFGRENVLVVPFEELRRDMASYVRRITSFAQAREVPEETLRRWRPEKVSFPEFRLEWLRRSNKFDAEKSRSVNPAALDVPVLRRVLRAISKLAPRLPASITDPYRQRIRAAIARRVGTFYEESNRRLGELVAWSPAECGYMLPPGSGRPLVSQP